jgi:putative ABC transport system substrate-binding protein
MKRREFLAALAGAVSAWPGLAFAQQNQPPKRVGFLAHQPLPPVQRFREKLHALGWVEGKNIFIDYRYAEGRDDRFPEFAAELVSMPVDVLVAWGSPAAFAAKRATTTIPILIGAAGDVVNIGLISNLARPDANLTGFIALNVELESKRLELLKEAVPHLSRVTILANPANPLNQFNLETARKSAEKLGVKIEVVEIHGAADIENALIKVKETRPDAVLLASDTLMLSKRKEIADFMAENRIPAIYPFNDYAGVGGLFTYGANISVLFRTRGGISRQAVEGREGRQFAGPTGDRFRIDRQCKIGGGARACRTTQYPVARG